MTDIIVPQQLPLFEGHRPSSSGVRLTGQVTTPFRGLSLDEEVTLIVKGRPERACSNPENCHPPKTCSSAPPLDMYFRPAPNGSS